MEIATSLYDTLEEGVDEPLEYELFSSPLDTPPETSEHPSKLQLLPHLAFANFSDVEFEGNMTIELWRANKKQRGGDVVRNGHKKVGVKIVVKMGTDKGTLQVEAKNNRNVLGIAKIDYGKTHARQYRPRAPGAL